MKSKYLFLTIFFSTLMHAAFSQQRVGINTTNPLRQLDIYKSGSPYLRLYTSTALGSQAGLELIRGDNVSNARDWKFENADGHFKIMTGTNNFSSMGDETFRITPGGYVGIGTNSPLTRLHVEAGEDASNTLDGYLMLGTKTGDNIVIDDNEILARQNGNSSTLYLQSTGGNTWFGGGDVFMGSGGGKVNIGGASLAARFNVDGIGYQIQLKNEADGNNDWFIGASSGSWQTGDDQLLFSPTTAHLDATLRLRNVADNDGFDAPVMISTSSTQTLLFDGNEIDSESGLFINHNSNEETYINPTGGKVGVGNSNPSAMLHLKTEEQGLGLQRDFATWWITPTAGGSIQFYKNTALLAYFSDDTGGEYVAVSDRRLKENIRPLGSTMEKIMSLHLYSYYFKHDPLKLPDFGVIAQEVEPIFPEVVSYGNDQYGVAYDELTVIAIKGIQEQQDQLEEMMRKVELLLRE